MGLVLAFTTGYFAAHHLLDFFVNIPAIFLAFAIPSRCSTQPPSAAPSSGPWSTSLGSRPIRILAARGHRPRFVVAVWVEVVALRHADAVALANEGRWAEANDARGVRRGIGFRACRPTG